MKFVPKYQTPAGTVEAEPDYGALVQAKLEELKKTNAELTEDDLKRQYGTINTPLTLNNATVWWDGEKWVPIKRNASQYQKQEPGEEEDPKAPDVWTDWIPHTAGLITDLVASTNNYREAAKQTVPLQSTYKENTKVTDGYLYRQQYAKQAADIRAQANSQLTSDPVKNAKIKLAYEQEAQKAIDKGNAISDTRYQESLQKAQEAENEYLKRSVQTANDNLNSLAANQRYIAAAKQKMNSEQATAMKTFGNNMYKDATSFIQAMKTNAAYKKARANQLAYTQEAQKKQQDFRTLWDDPANSEYYKNFAKYVQTEDALSKITGEIPDPGTDAYDQWLRDMWDTNELAESYRKQFTDAYDKAYQALSDELITLKSQYDFKDLDGNYYEIGSVVGPLTTISRTAPKARRIVTTHAKGGKAERFIDYAKVAQKEIESSRRQVAEASKSNARVLNQQLERLTKEQLALLKEIFK